MRHESRLGQPIVYFPGASTPCLDGIALRQEAYNERELEMNDALRMERRNVYIGDRRTTLALEHYFWKTLEGISFVENMTIDEILTTINEARRNQTRLTATVRYVINQTVQIQYESEDITSEFGESKPIFPSAFHQAMDTLNNTDPANNN